MKKSIFIALLLTLFAGSAMALTKGETMRCTGKLHSCFQNNYDDLIAAQPTSSLECAIACYVGIGVETIGPACTPDECEARCLVAFGISTSPAVAAACN